MFDEIMKLLKTAGFNQYEAKAYLTLLYLGKSSAREIGEKSKVPQSRIYSVLNSLCARGFIEIQSETPSFYYANDPERAFMLIKNDFCEKIDTISVQLKKIYREINGSSPFWEITSERGIEIIIKTLINNARHEVIIMAINPNQLIPIKSTLKNVKKRINLTVLVPDRQKFSGTGISVTEMGEDLINLLVEMHTAGNNLHVIEKSLQYDKWEDEFFILFDGMKAVSIGDQQGKKTATVITMPTYCFMMKKIISFYQPSDDQK